MQRVAWDKDQIAGRHALDLVADAESAFTVEDQYQFVVIGLYMQRVARVFEQREICGNVFAVADERALDRLVCGRRIGVQAFQCIEQSNEMSRSHRCLQGVIAPISRNQCVLEAGPRIVLNWYLPSPVNATKVECGWTCR